MNKFNSNLWFAIALICAIWFMLTSWFWTYGMNVIISFPFGLLSYIFWRRGKKNMDQKTRYKVVGIILLFGVLSSVGTLIGLLVFN